MHFLEHYYFLVVTAIYFFGREAFSWPCSSTDWFAGESVSSGKRQHLPLTSSNYLDPSMISISTSNDIYEKGGQGDISLTDQSIFSSFSAQVQRRLQLKEPEASRNKDVSPPLLSPSLKPAPFSVQKRSLDVAVNGTAERPSKDGLLLRADRNHQNHKLQKRATPFEQMGAAELQVIESSALDLVYELDRAGRPYDWCEVICIPVSYEFGVSCILWYLEADKQCNTSGHPVLLHLPINALRRLFLWKMLTPTLLVKYAGVLLGRKLAFWERDIVASVCRNICNSERGETTYELKTQFDQLARKLRAEYPNSKAALEQSDAGDDQAQGNDERPPSGGERFNFDLQSAANAVGHAAGHAANKVTGTWRKMESGHPKAVPWSWNTLPGISPGIAP